MGKLIEVDYEEMYLVDAPHKLVDYLLKTQQGGGSYDDMLEMLKKFVDIYVEYVNDSAQDSTQYEKEVVYLYATITTKTFAEWYDIFIDFCYSYNIYDDFECYQGLVALLIDNYEAPEDKFMPMCRVLRADDGLEEYYCLKII